MPPTTDRILASRPLGTPTRPTPPDASSGPPVASPPRTPPRGGAGGFTEQLLRILPLIATAIVGARNPGAGGAFAQGVLGGQQVAHQQALRQQQFELQQRLLAQREEAERNRALRDQRTLDLGQQRFVLDVAEAEAQARDRRGQRQLQRGREFRDLTSRAEEATREILSPQEYADVIEVYERLAVDAGVAEPGEIRRAVPFVSAGGGRRQSERDRQVIKNIVDTQGVDSLRATIRAGGTIGGRPAGEVARNAGLAVGPDGEISFSEPSDRARRPNSEFMFFLNAQSAALGKRPEDMTAEEIIDARRRFSDAGRAPLDQLSLNQDLNMTRRLREDAEAITAARRELNSVLGNMNAALEEARSGGSIDGPTQTIVIAFNRMNDPTSVVRESEYARSIEGQRLIDRLRGQVQRLERGGPGLTVEQLESFVRLAQRFNQNALSFERGALSRIRKTGERFLTPQQVEELIIPKEEELAIPTIDDGPQLGERRRHRETGEIFEYVTDPDGGGRIWRRVTR